MSELKPCPCPICGAELKIYSPEDWAPTFYDPDSGGDPYAANCDCGFSFQRNDYDYVEFIAALNRRTQPDQFPDPTKLMPQPTNADRIRAMSDEELHCFLLGFQTSTISDYKRGIMPNAEKCLDFLRQPAEEG